MMLGFLAPGWIIISSEADVFQMHASFPNVIVSPAEIPFPKFQAAIWIAAELWGWLPAFPYDFMKS